MDAKEIELAKSTPMMSRWWEIKSSLDDEIVFCRVGDFYELFFDDAEKASKLLDIQLTRRKIQDTTYPMAGVPVRSLDTYVARLVEIGEKVAIIDQLEDAKQSKGMVKRGLTKIVTTGTVTDDMMLSPGKNNYLAAICHKENRAKTEYGIAVCDLSTGDFRAGTFSDEGKDELLRAYSKYAPVEILHEQELDNLSEIFDLPLDNDEVLTAKPSFWFDPHQAKKIIYQHFNVGTTKGFDLEDNSMGTAASGAIIRYLNETQFTDFPHLSAIKSLDVHETMMLDATAIQSLELFENTRDRSSYATLLDIMDETITPMGGRLLRHWMANPLANKEKIEKRLNSVSLFYEDSLLQHQIRSILSEMGDIERLITRISMGSAKPDELIKLANSLEKIPKLRSKLDPLEDYFPNGLIKKIDPSKDIVHKIRKTIKSQPSSEVGTGGVIQYGYNSELDRLRDIIEKGESWLDDYIDEQKKSTGIETIKVKQNNHLGYFLDVSKKELEKVPENYVRKQVMVNSTRFFTKELKDWESEIIEAEIKILELETSLYESILSNLSEFVNVLQSTGQAVAQLDCLCSFSYLADHRNYSRPSFRDDYSLNIKGGRHPVIEALNPNNEYVPNDVEFEYDNQRILIITGPNFSGKSSLLRATALIAIMAHMGCYVPANTVDLGIIDRIFTRIGASDNLVAGQSTFMLEMVDAANLVNNSTERSLVIADELGRGTSTYDGLAIAWAITEYLHSKSRSPKTMIATHYHQLAELEDLLPTVKNFQFVIKFKDGQPIFDHKLEIGSSDKSFGVEVAKLAGLPESVIERGRTILQILESKAAEVDPEGERSKKLSHLILVHDNQASLDNWFGEIGVSSTSKSKPSHFISEKLPHPVLSKLSEIDPDNLTPIESHRLITELKEMLENE